MADNMGREIKFCKSCFTPMHQPEHFAQEEGNSFYCSLCCDDSGTLRDKREIKAEMISYCMNVRGMDKKEAKDYVLEHMHKLPEWRK